MVKLIKSVKTPLSLSKSKLSAITTHQLYGGEVKLIDFDQIVLDPNDVRLDLVSGCPPNCRDRDTLVNSIEHIQLIEVTPRLL